MEPEPDPMSIDVENRYKKRNENIIEGYCNSSPAMEPDLMYYTRDMKVPLLY